MMIVTFTPTSSLQMVHVTLTVSVYVRNVSLINLDKLLNLSADILI